MASADEILGIAPKPPMAPADRVLAAVPGARVTSTWRSRAKQDALIAQGLTRATNSHHLDPTGAVDFVPPPGMTEAQALAALRAQDPNPTELLAEGSHVHYAPGGPHATADSVLGLSADNVLGVNQPPAPPPSAAAQAQAKAQFSGWNSMGHGAAATPTPKPMRKPGPLADLRRNYDTARNAGAAALQEGVGSVMNGTAVSDPLETLKAAGNIAGGGFSYLMSPITGALATYPGHQVEQITGGRIPADVFGNDIVNIGIGAAAFGGAKPKIGETPRPSAISEYAPEAGGTGAAIRRGRAAAPKPTTVRLYRGEQPFDPAMVDPGVRRGGYFSDQESVARRYAGTRGTVSYVDLPAEEAAKYASKNNGTGMQPEHLLPPEIAAQAKPLAPVTADAVLGVKPQRAIAADVETPDTLASDTLVAPRGPRTPPPGSERPLGPTGVAATPGLRSVISKIAPEMVNDDARTAAHILWANGGKHALDADQTAYKLVQLDNRVGDMPLPRYLQFTDYLEGRSAGAKLADPKLQPVADTIRDTMKGYRDKIEGTLEPSQVPNFLEDYFAHMWAEDPKDVVARMSQYMGRQGSGRNFNMRTVPTMRDGVEAGLTPLSTNPVQTSLMYAANMSRYVNTLDNLNQLKQEGLARFYRTGAAPEGWVPLDGIHTTRIGGGFVPKNSNSGEVIPPYEERLYAPPSVAGVYNPSVSQGFRRDSAMGAMHSIANASIQLKLGLSGFHGVTMTNEALASEAARAVNALAKGDLPTAAKAGATWATVVGPAVKYTLRGNRMRDELLKGAPTDPLSQQINDLYIAQGGRVSMDKVYRATGQRSFYDTLKQDIGDVAAGAKEGGRALAAQRFRENLTNGAFVRDIRNTAAQIYKGSPWQVTKNHAALAGKVIQSVAAPIFEEYVPRLKQGAFATLMSDAMRQNPNASDAELLAMAKEIGDSVDNRFGELVSDNLFWDRKAKELAQIALVSPTWNLGTIREIGGGLADIPGTVKGLLTGKGLNVSKRTAYVAGLAATTALTSAIYQYLKTGKTPQSAQDLYAPQTGGTQRVGGKYGKDVPERAAIPGYQKDVLAFGYDFPNHILEEGVNKLNTFPRSAVELATNRDHMGKPIYPGKHGTLGENAAALGEYAADTAAPISAGAFQRKKGSKISAAERILGLRESPGYVAAPQITTAQARKREQKAWDWKTSSDKAAARRMESSY